MRHDSPRRRGGALPCLSGAARIQADRRQTVRGIGTNVGRERQEKKRNLKTRAHARTREGRIEAAALCEQEARRQLSPARERTQAYEN